MYQRVLIAVDGTEISELALLEAIQFVRVLQGTLCIAHGVDAVTANAYSPADRDRLLAEHRKGGWAVLQKAADIAQQADLSCEQRLLEIDTGGRGRLPELILREAERWGADVVFVGTHARGGVSHLLLGSVAEGLVRIATKPVVVVPAGAGSSRPGRDQGFARLLLAIDGTDASLPALRAAIELARGFGAVLRLVHSAADSGQAEAVFDAALAECRSAGVNAAVATLQAARQAGAIAKAVVADATAWPADLILLGTHARCGLDRLRQGSVAEAVFRHAPAPVMVASLNVSGD